MIVLGVAGPLASGKSTVLEMLEELGAATLRADDISRELFQPGQPVLEQVRAAFGEEYLTPAGELKRNKLAELIFADGQARQRLNRIMHPLMVERLREMAEEHRRSANPPPVIAIEAAILHQMGLDQVVDKILLVTAPEPTRIRRLCQRDGISDRQAQRRVELHDELGLGQVEADYIIDTNGKLAETRQQVEQLWAQLMGLIQTQ
ncbi:MAG: dephospho-CoA kinase [Armatimonadetes bacterium]|nr:dephospho-CoA kinase [Armatimonadota bacterium]